MKRIRKQLALIAAKYLDNYFGHHASAKACNDFTRTIKCGPYFIFSDIEDVIRRND